LAASSRAKPSRPMLTTRKGPASSGSIGIGD
jgi:hypothetical protein